MLRTVCPALLCCVQLSPGADALQVDADLGPLNEKRITSKKARQNQKRITSAQYFKSKHVKPVNETVYRGLGQHLVSELDPYQHGLEYSTHECGVSDENNFSASLSLYWAVHYAIQASAGPVPPRINNTLHRMRSTTKLKTAVAALQKAHLNGTVVQAQLQASLFEVTDQSLRDLFKDTAFSKGIVEVGGVMCTHANWLRLTFGFQCGYHLVDSILDNCEEEPNFSEYKSLKCDDDEKPWNIGKVHQTYLPGAIETFKKVIDSTGVTAAGFLIPSYEKPKLVVWNKDESLSWNKDEGRSMCYRSTVANIMLTEGIQKCKPDAHAGEAICLTRANYLDWGMMIKRTRQDNTIELPLFLKYMRFCEEYQLDNANSVISPHNFRLE